MYMMSLQRERTFILSLLVLVTASWAILISQSRTAQGMDGGLTMGMGVALFLALWVVMMVAMMVPSALPAILAVAQAQQVLQEAVSMSQICAQREASGYMPKQKQPEMLQVGLDGG